MTQWLRTRRQDSRCLHHYTIEMKETADLQRARNHLNKVRLLDGDAAYHIEEGFLILGDLGEGNTPEKTTAENLGKTYMSRFHSFIKEKLEDKHISQPDMESLLRSVIALETTAFNKEVDMEPLRIEIASRLIESYFQGYSDDERSEIIEELMARIDGQGNSIQ